MVPCYEMWVTADTGERFLAFTWVSNNVERGKKDARRIGRRFGYNVVDVEAVPTEMPTRN